MTYDLMHASAMTSGSPEIRPLGREDLQNLRLRRNFRFDLHEVEQIIKTNPDTSFWIPETDELILVGNWRNRSDLHAIQGLAATAGEAALIRRALERARENRVRALLMVDADELRRPVFYAKYGFQTIDHIATYELPAQEASPDRSSGQQRDITFSRILPDDAEGRSEVEQLDHLAFPWFWWNVAEEFDAYIHQPGVEIWIGIQNERVVSYIGVTHYGGWGHLDRIATHPDFQRSGIGAASLEVAIRLLRVHGTKRIALSTQGENAAAQRMYERRGFVRTPAHDYTVHGFLLDAMMIAEASATVQDQEIVPRHQQGFGRKK